MSADLYAAWLTAGYRLQPAGAWIAANWPWLAPVAAAVVFAAWSVWRSIRQAVHTLHQALHGDDYRTRNDQDAAQRIARLEGRPEPAAPGTDIGLYLGCVAIYDDCDDLDRLRDAIDQHRTGEK